MAGFPPHPPALIDKVLRLLTISVKQALSSVLWKKGNMMENNSRPSQQSLPPTVLLCVCAGAVYGWRWGQASRQIILILELKGDS